MIQVTTRFNIRSLANMIAQLEAWIESSQESLDNEELREHPNNERVDSLTDRLDNLNSALDSLSQIE